MDDIVRRLLSARIALAGWVIRQHGRPRDQRGSLTMEQIFWTAFLLGIGGTVAAAYKYFSNQHLGLIK